MKYHVCAKIRDLSHVFIFLSLSLNIRRVFSSNTMATLFSPRLIFGATLISHSVPFLCHRFVFVLFLSFFDILLYSEVMQYDCIQEFVIGGNAYVLLCRFLQTLTPCNLIALSHLKAVQVCKTWLSAVSSKNACLFFNNKPVKFYLLLNVSCIRFVSISLLKR